MTKDEVLHKVTDKEAREVLDDLPLISDYMKYVDSKEAKKARICINDAGELFIFPEDGGLLAVKVEHVTGDIAPFSD